MRVVFITLVALVLFLGCGSGKVDHAWRGEAKGFIDKYKEMMLKGDQFQASYYLKDAIKEAQKDSSLQSLATVYLTECAMQYAMHVKTSCETYDKVARVLKEPRFEAFKAMLLKQEIAKVKDLGKYESVYEAIEKKAVTLSNISSLDTIYAQAIAAKLIYDAHMLDHKMIDYMIEEASKQNLHGLMLLWLKVARSRAKGVEKSVWDQKIELLSPTK